MTRSAERTTAALMLLLVGAVLAVAGGRALELLDPGTAKRVVGVLFSVMLVVAGNMLPKFSRPLSALRAPDASMAADRAVGVVLVLLGVSLSAVFVFVPMPQLMLVASVIGISALVSVAGMWGLLSRGERLPALDTAQGLLLLLVHTLLWVFVMFFVDQLWGDQAAQWLSIGFVVVQSVAVSVLLRRAMRAE